MKPLFHLCVTVLIYSSIVINDASALNRKGTSKKNSTKPVVSAPQAVTTRPPSLPGFKLPCSCAGGQCACCTGVVLDQFNQKACLNITYEPDDFALTTAMTMNGRVLYKRTVSGKNPPPMCIRVPRVPFIRFCVEFSNIYFASRNIHLCIDMEANWDQITLLEWSFDCIRMGTSGVAVVGPEDGGGLPAKPVDAVDQTDEDYDDSARNAPLLTEIDAISSPGRRRLPNIIFDASTTVRNATSTSEKLDRSLIRVQQLNSGDYLISYNNKRLKR